MIDIQKMVQSAEEALGWPYVSPGSNDKNGIDCSGLFVKIFRDQGSSIYHGSNRIFRKYCSETGKMDISKLEVGMAVFKWKDQQPSGYSDNLGDFHHIGLVVSVNPIQIIHASSAAGKVTIDTKSKLSNWAYWGKLKDVNYEGHKGSENMLTATVYSENGKPVKMRAKPSTSTSVYWDIPSGTIVEVLENGDTWSQISHNGRTGYMMSQFLKMGEVVPGETENEGDFVSVSRIELERAYDILGDLLGLRG